MCTHTYTYMCTHTCVQTHIYTVYAHIRIHTRTQTQICAHTHKHTYMHAQPTPPRGFFPAFSSLRSTCILYWGHCDYFLLLQSFLTSKPSLETLGNSYHTGFYSFIFFPELCLLLLLLQMLLVCFVFFPKSNLSCFNSNLPFGLFWSLSSQTTQVAFL